MRIHLITPPAAEAMNPRGYFSDNAHESVVGCVADGEGLARLILSI